MLQKLSLLDLLCGQLGGFRTNSRERGKYEMDLDMYTTEEDGFYGDLGRMIGFSTGLSNVHRSCNLDFVDDTTNATGAYTSCIY